MTDPAELQAGPDLKAVYRDIERILGKPDPHLNIARGMHDGRDARSATKTMTIRPSDLGLNDEDLFGPGYGQIQTLELRIFQPDYPQGSESPTTSYIILRGRLIKDEKSKTVDRSYVLRDTGALSTWEKSRHPGSKGEPRPEHMNMYPAPSHVISNDPHNTPALWLALQNWAKRNWMGTVLPGI